MKKVVFDGEIECVNYKDYEELLSHHRYIGMEIEKLDKYIIIVNPYKEYHGISVNYRWNRFPGNDDNFHHYKFYVFDNEKELYKWMSE